MMSAVPASAPEPQVGVLLVSSNADLRRDLNARLKPEWWRTLEATSGAHALDCLESSEFDLLLLDPNLPDLDSSEFRGLVHAQFPHLQILLLDPNTGLPLHGSAATNPVTGKLLRVLGTASVPAAAVSRLVADAAKVGNSQTLPGMVGESEAMQRVYYMTQLVARRETTVLISGASGTGKDLVAQAIHLLSLRRSSPFVVINCAAIPEALLEAELFGYTKGAFTGAVQSRIGRIHSAQGGTLFLDEIGELPIGLQSKLLRFLEQGEVQRLGSSDTFRVDVRVIAATNLNLRKLIEEQKFREDLYYRLAVFPIGMPPLKDHLADLPILVANFLQQFTSSRMSISSEAMERLAQHDWPGNVRELRNVIERATILASDEGQILAKHILL